MRTIPLNRQTIHRVRTDHYLQDGKWEKFDVFTRRPEFESVQHIRPDRTASNVGFQRCWPGRKGLFSLSLGVEKEHNQTFLKFKMQSKMQSNDLKAYKVQRDKVVSVNKIVARNVVFHSVFNKKCLSKKSNSCKRPWSNAKVGQTRLAQHTV